MPRIAYCVIPEAGGLFRFYKNLRAALDGSGFEVLAPSVGVQAAARWDDAFADEGCALIAPEESDLKRKAMALVGWLVENRIDVLMPMDESIAASTVPHLPPHVRLVTRCSSGTPFAYRTCVFGNGRLCGAVATTPRQERGLTRQRRHSGNRLWLIPNGVDLSRFARNRERTAESRGPIQLAMIGRLDDSTKGVLWLPEVVAELARRRVESQVEVIGDGPDRSRLVDSLHRHGVTDRVRLWGTSSAEGVAGFLGRCDVLILPSRVEGSPNVLMEAMAAGVVPVASRISGVTDFIVEDGVTGLLCRIGRTREFAAKIAELAADRARLTAMSAAARRCVEERFSLERMGRDYERLFREVLAEPAPRVAPRPWSEFRLEPAYRAGWRRWVPRTVKNTLRRYLC